MNELVSTLISQIIILLGWAIIAVIFGRAFAHGISNELKSSVPKWIHEYVKETSEARVIANARNKMDEYNGQTQTRKKK